MTQVEQLFPADTHHVSTESISVRGGARWPTVVCSDGMCFSPQQVAVLLVLSTGTVRDKIRDRDGGWIVDGVHRDGDGTWHIPWPVVVCLVERRSPIIKTLSPADVRQTHP